MLIDIHVHIARNHSAPGSGGRYYPTPEEMLGFMDEAGIDMAVVMARVSPECGIRLVPPADVLEMCALHPKRLIPFCNLDPRMLTNGPDADFRPMLRYYRECGCKGIGEYLPNLPFDDPLNMNLFRQAAEMGMPITFHIGPTLGGCYGCYDELGLPRLEKVMREIPDLKLFGHSQPFWSEIGADVTEQTRGGYPKGPVKEGRLVHLMRTYPNLYGDLSAGSGLNAISRDPAFGYGFMTEFQDRLFFGTDICSHNVADWSEVTYLKESLDQGGISREVYDKITWKNANRVLGFGIADCGSGISD